MQIYFTDDEWQEEKKQNKTRFAADGVRKRKLFSTCLDREGVCCLFHLGVRVCSAAGGFHACE